jgi:DNA uptake protein ComE-like DNA-binding protein
MRPETYEALTEQLFIDSDKVQKLRLNTITFEDLYKHPYLSYAQANSIVKMRAQSNGFKNITEIKKSKLIDSKTFDKLFPYLIIE